MRRFITIVLLLLYAMAVLHEHDKQGRRLEMNYRNSLTITMPRGQCLKVGRSRMWYAPCDGGPDEEDH